MNIQEIIIQSAPIVANVITAIATPSILGKIVLKFTKKKIDKETTEQTKELRELKKELKALRKDINKMRGIYNEK